MTELDAFAAAVKEGLSADPKCLPTRYIYDEQGSALFEQIMQLPEYYLTRTEEAILKEYAPAIIGQVGKGPVNVVELGAGNGEKTLLLLKELKRMHIDYRFYPIDISPDALEKLERTLRKSIPDCEMHPLVMEYRDGLKWLHGQNDHRVLALFLGSNIGNFGPEGRAVFLQGLKDSMNPGDMLLIGFDRKKDYRVIQRAYDDPAGITRAFTLNVLHRINRELGANFNMDKFGFYGTYNPVLGANEAFLYSREDQKVLISHLGESFRFGAWEPVHAEYSFKFNQLEIEALATNAGFGIVSHFTDIRQYFTDSLWLCG